MRRIATALRPRMGDWTPGQINAALAAVQLLLTVQGASRGEDYVIPRPDGAPPIGPTLLFIEESSQITTAGVAFLVGAGLIVHGLAGGWTRPMWLGHGVLFALYVAVGWSAFNTVPAVEPVRAVVWGAVLGAGLFLVMSRWRQRNWLRYFLAMTFTGVGGWMCGFALGYDFRSATGLLIAAGAHFSIGFGLAWLTEKHRPHPLLDRLAAVGRDLRGR